MSNIYASLVRGESYSDKIKIVFDIVRGGKKIKSVSKSSGFLGMPYLSFIMELRIIISNAINGRGIKCKNDCEVRVVVDEDSGEYSCYLGGKDLMVDGVMDGSILSEILKMI